jgi:flagellar assembly protein FliH
MNASKANKFNFDTVFSEDGEVVRAAQRQRPKTSYTPEEVEAIKQDAFAQGAKNAEAAATAALAQALKSASTHIANLLKRQDASLAVTRAEASSLALAAARRVAAHALTHYPLAEIERVIATALHEYHGESRLVLRVNPDLTQPMQARLPGLIEAEGFMGRVIVAADPSLRGADCRIEWNSGGLERNEDAIFSAMQAEIERWHAAEAAASTQSAQGSE